MDTAFTPLLPFGWAFFGTYEGGWVLVIRPFWLFRSALFGGSWWIDIHIGTRSWRHIAGTSRLSRT